MTTDFKLPARTQNNTSSVSEAFSNVRMPPHSQDAEQAVLGGLMLDHLALEKISDVLRPEDFYRADHRKVYEAILDLSEGNKPFDAVMVAEWLSKRDQLEEAGGVPYLVELVEAVPTAANILAYAQMIRESSVLRKLIDVGTQVVQMGYRPEGRAAAEVMEFAEREIFSIADEGERLKRGFRPIKELMTGAMDRVAELFEREEAITGHATGFKDFDEMTSGLQAGDLVIVAGRPSMGKTTFAMNIAEHVAISGKKAVAVFSMEMPGEQLALRMLSSIGRVDQTRVRTGRLDDQDWHRLTSAVGILSQTQIHIDDTPALSPSDLRSRARRLARTCDLGVIVVDYLQLMQVPGTKENRTNEISEISRSLKSIAKELSVPVIALSQLNRSLEQRPNKRPVMSDLRESGAIEQDADLIVFIYRDEVYDKESPQKGMAEIIIGKQRNGPIGNLFLTFRGQNTRFEDYIPNDVLPEGYHS
ncbi:replicative DNA helicase [Halothiobacillus neapolitanus c2]|jgi:replicative DNA helicase|uniref:Replicative DNA helicase n=2 Tax=Halothiobacillaceae TaxID=255526 RepID=D0KZG6_HALNC|nr:replicative DNA helicase [Halothiobacillus neapolitanus c2]OZB37277.1 MAG: replicative DNA helicase [Halothiobacillus sp. 15-55-196]TDN66150.1 primary replicative DNA helicase [Halothiobacillus neapolitanus]